MQNYKSALFTMDPQQFGKGQKSERVYLLLWAWLLISFSLDAAIGLQEIPNQKETILAYSIHYPLGMFSYAKY